ALMFMRLTRHPCGKGLQHVGKRAVKPGGKRPPVTQVPPDLPDGQRKALAWIGLFVGARVLTLKRNLVSARPLPE
ncbi:hypothetical protein, partial [Paraburkholderia tropica]|uniref:hypothetical protein n=1 Tax=Paraburkholderia tropica TaxID=92647 RepID=UPI002AB63FEF